MTHDIDGLVDKSTGHTFSIFALFAGRSGLPLLMLMRKMQSGPTTTLSTGGPGIKFDERAESNRRPW